MRLFLRVLASYGVWRFLWCQLSWIVFIALLMTPPILLYLCLDSKSVWAGIVFLFNLFLFASLVLLWAMINILHPNVATYTPWAFIQDVWNLIVEDYEERKAAIIAEYEDDI